MLQEQRFLATHIACTNITTCLHYFKSNCNFHVVNEYKQKPIFNYQERLNSVSPTLIITLSLLAKYESLSSFKVSPAESKQGTPIIIHYKIAVHQLRLSFKIILIKLQLIQILSFKIHIAKTTKNNFISANKLKRDKLPRYYMK